jgi:hypothetical protein
VFTLSGVNEKVSFGNLTLDLRASTNENDERKGAADVEFASISLLNGLLLSSMSKVVLTEPLPGFPGVSFLPHIFPKVCQLARSRYVYNGFQLLHLWYQTYIRSGFLPVDSQGQGQISCSGQGQNAKCCQGHSKNCCSCQSLSGSSQEYENKNTSSDVTNSVSDDRLFSESSTIATETLQLIWTNWDNPVKGVPEFVARIFSCLLKCSEMESKIGSCQSNGLLSLVKVKIMKTPWNIRGKHRLLTALLECLNSQKVNIFEYVDLMENTYANRAAARCK